MFAEDLTVFMSTSEFADSATLAGGAVVGIFDTSTEVTNGDAITVAPTFLLPTTSAGGASGAAFVHAGTTYRVLFTLKEPPDGAFTRLVLQGVA